MIRSVLLGAVAGARSMTPLAAVSAAAATGRLPDDEGVPALLGHPAVVAGTAALAAAELGGDKMPSAPDRIVVAGLAARLVTGAVAGAAMAPHDRRLLGGALGIAAAVGASYLTFDLRMRALRRWGQTLSGLAEDALVLAATALIVGARRSEA